MPEVTYAVTLTVTVADEAPNVNEVLAAAAACREEFGVKLAEAVLTWLDAEVRRRLCGTDRAAKKGLGGHARKDGPAGRCGGRSFVKAGRRPDRTLTTELGKVAFPVGQVRCRRCGRKLAPVIEALRLAPRQRHSDAFERQVVEATNRTSFARAVVEVAGLAGVPTSKSSAHRWMAGQDIPEPKPPPIEQLMADGTRFKGGPTQGRFKRRDLRVAIGFTSDRRIVPLGVWADKSWAEIGRLLKRRLARTARPALFVGDGEPALSVHLARLARREQRSHFHFLRDFGFGLWKDGLAARQTEPLRAEAARLLGVEIPAGDWEAIRPADRARLAERTAAARAGFEAMIADFDRRGYAHGAEYLRNAKDRLFGRIDLWLQTGIIAPKSTGVLEEIVREIGRRVKKLGWNWSDHGVTQQAKITLLRRYGLANWETHWRQRLDLRGRCAIHINTFKQVA